MDKSEKLLWKIRRKYKTLENYNDVNVLSLYDFILQSKQAHWKHFHFTPSTYVQYVRPRSWQPFCMLSTQQDKSPCFQWNFTAWEDQPQDPRCSSRAHQALLCQINTDGFRWGGEGWGSSSSMPGARLQWVADGRGEAACRAGHWCCGSQEGQSSPGEWVCWERSS